MAFLVQAKESPYWRVPVVDAEIYDQMARQMLRESWLGPLPNDGLAPYTPYFQPPLYQWFLALVYGIIGRSVIGVMIIQYVIGSLSCVLAYCIGQRFFGRGVGIAAGVAAALTASQVFYEGRLLPPVLITIFNLSIILLAAKQLKTPAAWRWPVIGLLLGLSAITRPDILLFVPLMIYWMWRERGSVMPKRPLLWTAVVLAGAALPVALVSVRNQVVGKDLAIISHNGGINFFIGNHPEMEKMLGIRPGAHWDIMTAWPQLEAGITRPSAVSDYFYKRAAEMMWKHKRITLQNFGRKLVWVWRGQEIHRNEDDYYFTRVSSVYKLLLWRKGDFGFPFGVIGPLGLLGMALALARRRDLFLLYAYVGTQVLMMVAFFPCSRYRAPIVPVLLMFGAFAVIEIVKSARRRQFGDLMTSACLLTAFAGLSMLYPPKFEGTPRQIEAENHGWLGYAHSVEGHNDQALAEYERSARIDPDNPNARKMLMFAYYDRGDYPTAEKHASELLKRLPGYFPVYQTVLDIYVKQGKFREADRFRDAVEGR